MAKHSTNKTTGSKCSVLAAQFAKFLSSKEQRDFQKWLSLNGHVVNVSPAASVPDIGDQLRKYIRRSKLKGCYDNAARLAHDFPGMRVVIGQVYTPSGSVDHAWNATERGIHFDVTEELLELKGMEPDFEEHYAVAIMTTEEYDGLICEGTSGSVLWSIYDKVPTKTKKPRSSSKSAKKT